MLKVLVRKKGLGRDLHLYYKDPESGREKSKSAETTDPKQAERKAADWERELQTTRGVDGSSWLWFRTRFVDEHLSLLSPSGRAGYKTALNHFERVCNPQKIGDVTASTLSRFMAKLNSEERPRETVRNYMRHVLSALNWAESPAQLIAHAPRFRMPRTLRSKKKKKLSRMKGRAITMPEFKAMLRSCRHVAPWQARQLRRFLWLLLLSGLRLEEAIRFSWDGPLWRINLAARPHPLIEIDGEGAQKSGEEEDHPMTPQLFRFLQKTPTADRQGRFVILVSSQLKRRLKVNKVSRLISAIGRHAKVVVNAKGKAASAHDLRRTFGTHWAPLVHPTVLQRLMRHKDLQTTLMYYVDLSTSSAAAAVWGEQKPADSQ